MLVKIKYLRRGILEVTDAVIGSRNTTDHPTGKQPEVLCCLEITHSGGKSEDRIPAYLERLFANCIKDDIVDVLTYVRKRSVVSFVVADPAPLPLNERIAMQIQDVMQERKLSAKALGKLIDMDPANISKILNGKTVPTVNVLNKLLVVLGMSLDLTAHYHPVTEDTKAPDLGPVFDR